MTTREKLASFLCSLRNLDTYSSNEAILHFNELTEEMIKELKMTEKEMHKAWMKKNQK